MKYMRPFELHRTRTISVTSGKGGVGKTTVIANLALSLAKKGKKVLILDGDLGMANVDIFFGVKSQGNVHDIISGSKEMHEILIQVSENVFLVPGGSGVVKLNQMNHFERRAVIEAVGALPMRFDYLLIDTATGINENVLFLNTAVQTVAVVITPDPASFTDAYALIKILSLKFKVNHFSIICNQVGNQEEGLSLYKRFHDVVNKFLLVGLEYLGAIPQDENLRKATQMQRLILRQDANSLSALAIRRMADQIDSSSRHVDSGGGMQLFWDQVIGCA